MKRSGTEMFVVGTSGLFNLDDNLEIAWDKMLQYMNKTMNIYAKNIVKSVNGCIK